MTKTRRKTDRIHSSIFLFLSPPPSSSLIECVVSCIRMGVRRIANKKNESEKELLFIRVLAISLSLKNNSIFGGATSIVFLLYYNHFRHLRRFHINSFRLFICLLPFHFGRCSQWWPSIEPLCGISTQRHSLIHTLTCARAHAQPPIHYFIRFCIFFCVSAALCCAELCWAIHAEKMSMWTKVTQIDLIWHWERFIHFIASFVHMWQY